MPNTLRLVLPVIAAALLPCRAGTCADDDAPPPVVCADSPAGPRACASVCGTGSPTHLARWQTTGRTLDASIVTDVNGAIGIGVAVAGQRLHIGDGNILLEGGGETALKIKRDITYQGGPSGTSANPIFELGRIIQAGDGDPEMRFLYSDDGTPERAVMEFDRKGIVASVRIDRGSHFEGFLSNTDPEPVFRLNSYPKMRLEMGEGGTQPVDVAVQREAPATLTLLTAGLERVRVDESGRVGIGTAAPSSELQVIGTVAADEFVVTSDARLKRDVEPLRGALEKVLAVRGVSYSWVDAGGPRAGRRLGVLAQEVEAVAPEAVRTDANGRHQVAYAALVSLLLEALKEEHHRARAADEDAGRALRDLLIRIDRLEHADVRRDPAGR